MRLVALLFLMSFQASAKTLYVGHLRVTETRSEGSVFGHITEFEIDHAKQVTQRNLEEKLQAELQNRKLREAHVFMASVVTEAFEEGAQLKSFGSLQANVLSVWPASDVDEPVEGWEIELVFAKGRSMARQYGADAIGLFKADGAWGLTLKPEVFNDLPIVRPTRSEEEIRFPRTVRVIPLRRSLVSGKWVTIQNLSFELTGPDVDRFLYSSIQYEMWKAGCELRLLH